jgi:hypothetical protein
MLGEGEISHAGCGSVEEDDSRLWLILAKKGRKSKGRRIQHGVRHGAFYQVCRCGHFSYTVTPRGDDYWLGTFYCERRLDLWKVACPVPKGTASHAGHPASQCIVCLIEVTLPPARLVVFSPKHNIDHLVTAVSYC